MACPVSFSLQDPTLQDYDQHLEHCRTPRLPSSVSGGYGANGFGGTRAPDLIGNVSCRPSLGSVPSSAVAHNNHAAYYGATEPTGHPDDKWGWAVQAALSIKNIPTGPGDVINMQAVYTDGASRYNFQKLVPDQLCAIYGGTGCPAPTRASGLAGVADGVFGARLPAPTSETVKTWGFRGGYTHNWDAYWASAIYGAYAQLRYGANSTAAICATPRDDEPGPPPPALPCSYPWRDEEEAFPA